MLKNEISTVVNNLKLNISSYKINLDIMEGFSMSTIDNKYVRSASILQFILRALASSIDVLSHFHC